MPTWRRTTSPLKKNQGPTKPSTYTEPAVSRALKSTGMPAGISLDVVRRKPGFRPSWKAGATRHSASRPKVKSPIPGDTVQ